MKETCSIRECKNPLHVIVHDPIRGEVLMCKEHYVKWLYTDFRGMKQ
jgi:hypothetical protein